MAKQLLKTTRINPLRCTPQAKAQVEKNAKAAGLSMAEFLVRRGLYEECPPLAKVPAPRPAPRRKPAATP